MGKVIVIIKTILISTIILLLCVTPISANATPPDKWTQTYFVPDYSAIAHNDKGIQVAIDRDGLISVNENSKGWKTFDPHIDQPLLNITTDGRKFVVVGGNGLIMTSQDGYSWEKEITKTKNWFFSVAWNGKIFMAVTEVDYNGGGQVYTSKDGYKWVLKSTYKRAGMKDLLWNGEKFIIVGESCKDHKGVIMETVDGNSIKMVASPVKHWLKSVAWDGKTYVAIGDDVSAVSRDGSNWESTNLYGEFKMNLPMSKVKKLSGGFIIVGYDYKKIYRSDDGTKWDEVDTKADIGTGYGLIEHMLPRMYSVDEYNGKITIVGETGVILNSQDGTNWAPTSPKNNPVFTSVVWGSDRFVAIRGDGLIFYSLDGLKWVQEDYVSNHWLQKIAWNGKRYVIIGTGGRILDSEDGIHWKEVDVDIRPPEETQQAWVVDLYNICCNEQRFIISGYMRVYSDEGTKYMGVVITNNGDEWTQIRTSIEAEDSLVFLCGDKYISASKDKLFISSDLKNWEAYDGEKRFLKSFAYGNGIITAAGKNGIYRSNDGVSWTKVKLNKDINMREPESIKWLNGKFYAFYRFNVYESIDGLKWEELSWGEAFDVAANGRNIVLVGMDYIKIQKYHE